MKDKDMVWCSYCGETIYEDARNLPKKYRDDKEHFCNSKCLELCLLEFPETFQEEENGQLSPKWRN